MDVAQVNQKLLRELEDMGFPLPRATRALDNSGNSSIEDAINWLVVHENDPDIDQMPLVTLDIEIEDGDPSNVTEVVKLKAEELRNRVRRKKEEVDKKLEREREKERRRSGKELLEAKKIQEENERKRLMALKKVEKEQDKRQMDSIHRKLQQDKAERRRRLGLPAVDPSSAKKVSDLGGEKEDSLVVNFATLHDTATKTELMRNCLRSLKRNHMDDNAKVREAFQTLLIYVSNVVRNPEEEKFRKIRFGNPAFQNRVGHLEEGVKFLELCGFERVEEGKFLFLPRDKIDMAVLRSAWTVLDSAITNPFFGLLSK
ncbi:hypothetical protein NMG60_11014239 [Bertholletia excelsa]